MPRRPREGRVGRNRVVFDSDLPELESEFGVTREMVERRRAEGARVCADA